MKKILTIVVVALCVIGVATVAKDAVIKMSVEKGVEAVTGLKLSVKNLKVGVVKPVVEINGLELFNPPAFVDRKMIDMPEIYVKYDLPAILGGKIHLPEVRLGLKEFVVVKNAKGELNLNSLRSVQAQKEKKDPAEQAGGKVPEIKIDLLKLSIGKVVYKDYSKGGAPDVKEFNINLNESYTDVNDPYKLASLIVVKALMNTSIGNLTNFDVKALQGTLGGSLAGAEKAAVAAVQTAQASLATTQATAGAAATTTAATAQEAAKGAAEAVKNVLKNPFGSDK